MKLSQRLLILIFGIHLAYPVPISAEYIYSDQMYRSSTARHIDDILRQASITAVSERKTVNKFLSGGEFLKLGKDDLSRLLARFNEKLKKDLYELKNLNTQLRQLLKNPYVKKNKKIKKGDLVDIEKFIKAIEKKQRDIRRKFFSVQKELPRRELVDGIKMIADLLIEEDESIRQLWNLLKGKINDSYMDWNYRYNDLKKVVKDKNKDFSGPKNYLSYDEKEFYRIFGAMQAILRKLDTDNADF